MLWTPMLRGCTMGCTMESGMWRYRTMLPLYWNARKKKEGKHPTTALARSSRDGIDL